MFFALSLVSFVVAVAGHHAKQTAKALAALTANRVTRE